jgi:hypothetical protein
MALSKKNRASQSGGDQKARGIVDTHICRYTETFSSRLCQAGTKIFKIPKIEVQTQLRLHKDNKS